MGVKSDWLVRLVQGFTVGLDLGLAGGLLVSSVCGFLLALKRLLGSGSRWGGGLGGGPAEAVGLGFLSSTVDMIILSVLLLLLTRRTMSLEEEIRGVFGSDSFLLRDVTLDGGLLSSGSLFSSP